MGFFGRSKSRVSGDEQLAGVVADGNGSAEPLPKNNKERLKRASTQSIDVGKQIDGLKGDHVQDEASLVARRREKDDVSGALNAARQLSSRKQAEAHRLQEEIGKFHEESHAASAKLQDCKRCNADHEEHSKSLAKQLDRLQKAHLALQSSSSDAGLTRSTLGSDAMLNLSKDASDLTATEVQQLQDVMFGLVAESAQQNIEESFFIAESAKIQEVVAAIEDQNAEKKGRLAIMESDIEPLRSDCEELQTRIRALRNTIGSGEIKKQALQEQHEQVAREIETKGAHTAQMQTWYAGEVQSVNPVLVVAKKSKLVADGLHAQRCTEIADALQVQHVRADASLNNSRAASRLDNFLTDGESLICEAPQLASKLSASQPALSLDAQLREIVAAAKEIAAGPAAASGGAAMRKAGRIVVGEVPAFFEV